MPPRPPDVEDEHLRSDEEDDERLDDRREVGGERRVEDARVERARGSAGLERGEEVGGEEDADGLVPPEERHGDAGEPDLIRREVARYEGELVSEHVDGAREPR